MATDNPHGFYILNAGKPEACPESQDWLTWYQATAEDRQVAKTTVNDHVITTTFTGIDYGLTFGSPRPLLWQVVVSKAGTEVWSARYRGRRHAMRSHWRLVDALTARKPFVGIEKT